MALLLQIFALLSLLSLSADAFVALLHSSTTFSPRRRACHEGPSLVMHATKRRRRRQGPSKGFGRKESPANKDEYTSSEKSIYSLPALYDLAFGYRNYEDEVDFLLQAHQLHSSSTVPTRILELAAGPARHSLTALSLPNSPVKSVTAVDTSPEMKKYALELADEQLPVDKRDSFEYTCSDMRHSLPTSTPFDSAWILLGSLQHLQTNKDVIDCFSCIHKSLKPGGTLIVELPHPRETFSMVECTKNGWKVPLDDEEGKECGELSIVWGDEADKFDEISQVRQFTVSFDLKTPQEKDRQRVRQIVPMRLFTAQEIDALATCSGFEVVSMYGALDMDVVVNDQDEAFRLVCVLKRI